MPAEHAVDELGHYDGKSLSELWPAVVDEIVSAVDPVEVWLFGSVARNDDGPDCDIDVLVILESLAAPRKRDLMARIRASITTFAPVDVLVADVAELEKRRDDVGSVLYWPTREGRRVYRRTHDPIG